MSGRVALVTTAGVFGAAVALASAAPVAAATTVPLAVDFGVVMPGASAQRETSFSVQHDAIVTDATWGATSGTGLWEAGVCTSGGTCTPVVDLVGDVLAAGDYRVVMGVTMPQDSAGSASTSAQGRLTLVEDVELPLTGGTLAATGGDIPWTVGLIGAVAAGVGAGLLLGRRKRDDTDSGSGA